MLRKGLVEGTAGNISARMPDGSICITPSSVDYDAMTLEDLCLVDLDGEQIEGERGPSSEKLLHLAIYKAFDDV
ncbi:MAG: fuculose phosphate aldolase, partial [Actinobacteria bacterium]